VKIKIMKDVLILDLFFETPVLYFSINAQAGVEK